MLKTNYQTKYGPTTLDIKSVSWSPTKDLRHLKEQLAFHLEQAAELAEQVELTIDDKPLATSCYQIIGELQRVGDVHVPDTKKNWGVKIFVPGSEPRWYSNERHDEFNATELAQSYNSSQGKDRSKRFKAERIPDGEKY